MCSKFYMNMTSLYTFGKVEKHPPISSVKQCMLCCCRKSQTIWRCHSGWALKFKKESHQRLQDRAIAMTDGSWIKEDCSNGFLHAKQIFTFNRKLWISCKSGRHHLLYWSKACSQFIAKELLGSPWKVLFKRLFEKTVWNSDSWLEFSTPLLTDFETNAFH